MKYIAPILFCLVVTSCSKTISSEEKPVGITSEKAQADLLNQIGHDYFIDDQHSYLGFKIKYFGYSPVRGRFNTFDGTAFYDTSDHASLCTTIFIDINSINTGNERRDNDLKREGTWFDAINHPYATFTSKQVVPNAEGGFELVGELTIKDSTKNVKFDFSEPTGISRDWAMNEQIDFEGKAIINRQDFGVYGGDFWSSVMENGLTQLSDEVELELNIHCRRADYQARYNDMDTTDVRKKILDVIRSDGFETASPIIHEAFKNEELSSGGMSTIGFVLNEWKRYEDAIDLFELKKKLAGENATVFTQLGITHLLAENDSIADTYFMNSFELDSINSRTVLYSRLMETMSR
ncbi:YceI family protein [Ekhidna sp.]|uniref:YceI family protein n=1 Tax=Ekhidna sp. TaxID=2608089 RepID=UPI003C7A1237